MKKLFATFLCLSVVGLYACEKAVSPSESTITEDTSTKTTTEGVSEITTTTIVANSSASEVKPSDIAPYSDILKAYIENFRDEAYLLERRCYALYDIDGNGTKELLIGADCLEDIGIVAAYAIKNGVAVEQELWWMDELPPILLFRNGTLRGEGSGDEGILSYGYYRFEAGELKWQMSLNNELGEYKSRYPSDPTKFISISKEDYDRLKQEFEGDGQVVELDWKPLAEYGQ